MNDLIRSLGQAAGLLVLAATAAAQPAYLVRDFHPRATARAPEFGSLTLFGDLVVAEGEDPAHGFEPWISDGTHAGTRRLADLVPGRLGSSPRFFLDLGGHLVFAGSDNFRQRIYGYSGTGPVELLATVDSYGVGAARLGAKAYFHFDHPLTRRREIYESDGTAAGTRRLLEFCPQAPVCYNDPQPLFSFGGAIYFGYDGELFRADPLPGPPIAQLTRADGFVALDADRFVMRGCVVDDCRLWVSDGTAAGTFKLEPPGQQWTSSPRDLTAFGGRVYAVNLDGQVVSVDGSVAGTRLEPSFPAVPALRLVGALPGALIYDSQSAPLQVHQLWAFHPNGQHEPLTTSQGEFRLGGPFGGRLVIYDSEQRLWLSDGSAAGTTEAGNVRGLGPGVVKDGFFYFTGYVGDIHAGRPIGLYRVGASGPAAVVRGPEPYPDGSEPRPFAAAGGIVAAVREEGAFGGDDNVVANLWRVNAQTLAASLADPRLFVPLAATGGRLYAQELGGSQELVAVGSAGVDPLGAHQIANPATRGDDGFLFFTTAAPGQDLWRSDGTAAGTDQLFDIQPGWLPGECFPPGSCPPELPASITASGAKLFFLADQEPFFDVGAELWVRPGPGEPPRFVADFDAYADLPELIPLSGGRVAFPVPSMDLGQIDLYVSDGTPGGTFVVRQLGAYPTQGDLLALGGRLISPNLFRRSLLVSDASGGESYSFLDLERISHLTVAGNLVYFTAEQGDGGLELWRTDTTPAGTRKLVIRPGPLSAIGADAQIFDLGDGRVAFAADDGIAGNELFVSDGTQEGTARVADIAPGPAASNPRKFARAGNRLFFEADDGEHGAELWAADLPPLRPACPPEKLCLLEGRFEAEVTARVGNQAFVGQRALVGGEAGVFTFFGPDNWEFLVKVLDGCAINQNFWVFGSAATDVAYELKITDRATGAIKTYRHAAGSPASPIFDLQAFASCQAARPPAAYRPALPIPPLAGRCGRADTTALCLGEGGRFKAKVTWTTADAAGTAIPVTYGGLESGLFTFFSTTNWELLVKVLDGCALNGRHWIYAAGTTDVGWRLEVEDLVTHETKVYESPLGQPSRTITDSNALGGCP